MGNKSRAMARSPLAANSVLASRNANSSNAGDNGDTGLESLEDRHFQEAHHQQQQQQDCATLGSVATAAVATAAAVDSKSYNNPSKITHGFWLQQYSWLHQDTSPASSTLSSLKQQSSQQQQTQSTPIKTANSSGGTRRLLFRWNLLVRSFAGGSSTGTSSPENRASGTRSAPPLQREKRQRKHWFAKPLSSSTSRLSRPPTQLPVGGAASEGSARRPPEQQQQQQSNKHLSPYKQLRALMSRSPIKQSTSRRVTKAGSGAPAAPDQTSPAFKSESQRPQSSGLFGNLFASPLFKRRSAAAAASSSSRRSTSSRRSKRDRKDRHSQVEQQQQQQQQDENDKQSSKKIRQSEVASASSPIERVHCQPQSLLPTTSSLDTQVDTLNSHPKTTTTSAQPVPELLAESTSDRKLPEQPTKSWLTTTSEAAQEPSTSAQKKSSGKRVKMGPRETLGESTVTTTTTTTTASNRLSLRRQVEVTGAATLVGSERQMSGGQVQFAAPENLSSVTSGQSEELATPLDQETLTLRQRMLPLIQPLATSSSSLASLSSTSSSTSASSSSSSRSSANSKGSRHSSASASSSSSSSSELALARAKPLSSEFAALPAAGVLVNKINDNDYRTSSLERPHSQPQPQQVMAAAETASMTPRPQEAQQQQQQQQQTDTKSQFKKLVKRQQSVDSYRMARELKNKQRRQQEDQQRHQSNEAIQGKPGAQQATGRKFSMRLESQTAGTTTCSVVGNNAQPLEIRVDTAQVTASDKTKPKPEETLSTDPKKPSAGAQRTGPTPPNTLSLQPSASGLQPFIVGSFSGCITPTYPTHHLPSPKYVSQAAAAAISSSKKYSNASTISSSLAADYASSATSYHRNSAVAMQVNGTAAVAAALDGGQVIAAVGMSGNSGATNNQSDTESSVGVSSATPSRGAIPIGSQVIVGGSGGSPINLRSRPELHTIDSHQQSTTLVGAANSNNTRLISGLSADQQQVLLVSQALAAAAREEEAAAAAARRAQLAEHIYDNKCGLGEDMKFLASLPELCDITFLVGETREPVCAVKAVLAARSRVFHKILLGANPNARKLTSSLVASAQQQSNVTKQQQQQSIEVDRRSSSPRAPEGRALASKSSSPIGRTPSPNNQQQQQQQQSSGQWSVVCDASGYNPPATPIDQADSMRSGRGSVARSGRDSVSATSQGSQQPLIIGPGQMAAPAKRNKKNSIRDSRLSRMFLRRASDPSMRPNQQLGSLALNAVGLGGVNQSLGSGGGAAGGGSGGGVGGSGSGGSNANQNYLDKMSSSQMSTTMIIEEFEPDVFRQLIEYIHTGCVLLQARTLLGLLNAADYYGLDQLRKACLRFVTCCITVDTVCSLLSTAERYIQYKCTKSIVQKVLEFVDTHAEEIFKLNAFGLLPEHVVRLILARDGLQADEQTKYNGVYTWCEHYCRSVELANITDVMGNFLEFIQFHKIPTNVLLSEIYPMRIVPDHIFLSALAIQADPQSFEPPPLRLRRMTLPNSLNYEQNPDGTGTDLANATNAHCGAQRKSSKRRKSSTKRKANLEQVKSYGADVVGAVMTGRGVDLNKRESVVGAGNSSELFGSHPTLIRDSPPPPIGAVNSRGRKSIGSQTSELAGRFGRLRKGSIAQVSISGVIRLSHKLSIKKRHSNIVGSSQHTVTGSATGKLLQHQTSASAASSSSSSAYQKDPLQIGQQILNAYLVEQQCALQEEAAKRAAAAAAAAAQQLALTGGDSSAAAAKQQQSAPKEQPIVKISSTRKSFRDFKHISRKIFMRHSSNKTLQQQHSTTTTTVVATTTALPAQHYHQQQQQQPSSVSPSTAAFTTTTTTATPLVATRSLATASTIDNTTTTTTTTKERDKSGARRKLLKIKRSETVFETTTGPHHAA